MNIRRRKECPLKLIGTSSKVKLSKLLADGGCAMGVAEFRQLAAACLEAMCKGQPIQEVLRHPREALSVMRVHQSEMQGS